MIEHPVMTKLRNLKLQGMTAGLADQLRTPEVDSLTFEERLGLLLDREATSRADRRLKTRLTQAKLRLKASINEVDHNARRNLDKALFLSLSSCSWIGKHQNLLISGPTGVGKTYLSCALAHKACQEGYKVLYQRLPRLLHDLEVSKGTGTYRTLLNQLQRVDLLCLDDWGVTPLTDANRRDLLEVLDDRYTTRSTLITSQLPPEAWHAYIGDPTLADAILDRFMHNAHQLNLRGESMRKTINQLTSQPTTSES